MPLRQSENRSRPHLFLQHRRNAKLEIPHEHILEQRCVADRVTQERARTMLEGYAAGSPVGSEFMGFELLREEMRVKNADPTGVFSEALTQIEKSMRNPAEVKAIAQQTLAALDTPAAPQP